MSQITVKKTQAARGSKVPALYVVFDGPEPIGLIEKYNGPGQPWKAHGGTGNDVRFLESFYGPVDFHTAREAAIDRVIAYAERMRRDPSPVGGHPGLFGGPGCAPRDER